MRKFILFIFLIVFVSIGGESHAVCDPTLTVCESGCDYDTLNAAVTDLETNCASPTEPLSIEISGTWSSADSTEVSISGISTTAVNTLTIYTTGSARHSGVWSTTAYRLIVTASGDHCINLINGYVIIDGIQFDNNNTFGNNSGIYINASSGDGIVIKNNIGRISSTVNGKNHISNAKATGEVSILNNILYKNTQGNGIAQTFGSGKTDKIYNNTVYNVSGTGITSGGNSDNVDIANNLSVGNGTDFDINAGVNTNSNNMSSDATGNSGYQNVTTADQFVSITGGSEDLHLVSDADAVDNGTDLSGTFTTDIDGDTRTGTWDIGADEYQATAAATTSVNNILTNLNLSGKLRF